VYRHGRSEELRRKGSYGEIETIFREVMGDRFQRNSCKVKLTVKQNVNEKTFFVFGKVFNIDSPLGLPLP